MKCRKVLNKLSFYIDNLLGNEETSIIQKHLKSCSKCNNEYNKFIEIKKALNGLNTIKAPANLEDAVIEKINKKEFEPSSSSVFLFTIKTSLTAAVFLFCIMAAVSFFTPSNRPVADNIDALDYYVLKDADPYIKITNSLLG